MAALALEAVLPVAGDHPSPPRRPNHGGMWVSLVIPSLHEFGNLGTWRELSLLDAHDRLSVMSFPGKLDLPGYGRGVMGGGARVALARAAEGHVEFPLYFLSPAFPALNAEEDDAALLCREILNQLVAVLFDVGLGRLPIPAELIAWVAARVAFGPFPPVARATNRFAYRRLFADVFEPVVGLNAAFPAAGADVVVLRIALVGNVFLGQLKTTGTKHACEFLISSKGLSRHRNSPSIGYRAFRHCMGAMSVAARHLGEKPLYTGCMPRRALHI